MSLFMNPNLHLNYLAVHTIAGSYLVRISELCQFSGQKKRTKSHLPYNENFFKRNHSRLC